MKFQDALEQARWHIKTLYGLAGIFLLVILLLIFCWHNSDANRSVYIPPEIPVDGLTQKAGDIPAATIYSFAYYVWQNINNWPNNGAQDYSSAINQFSPFLTPRFKTSLIQDYNNRLNGGEIQDRIRAMQGLFGSAFTPQDVQSLGHGTWIVRLTMHLSESMNMNGNTVKDIDVSYALRVVNYSVNAKTNPWGLALDGYEESTMRLKTNV